MARPQQRRRPRWLAASAALLLSFGAQTCSAGNGSIAAWLTTLGPQVIIQNATTNSIMYSDCNSNSTPIFDLATPKTFTLRYAPKANTPVAGTGYLLSSYQTAASFWYIDSNGDIVNSYQQCNPATGEFVSMNTDQSITSGLPKPSNNSGLAAMLLGSSAGYRIYYHDEDMNVQQISYSPTTQKFFYSGLVTQDKLSSNSISAAFSQYGNVSVIAPKASDIEVADQGSDNLWWLESFPHALDANSTNTTARTNITINKQEPLNYTLPAWDGNATLGLSINQDETLNVFYIGNDSRMYQLYSWYGSWEFGTNQTTAIWPLADQPNADFGIAWDNAALTIRMYYFSNGSLTEVVFDKNADGLWHNAAPVQTFNATVLATTNSTSNSTLPATSSHGSGLSGGAKAGIGVGVTVAGLGIIGAVLAFYWLLRRRASNEATLPAFDMTKVSPTDSPPAAPAAAPVPAPVLAPAPTQQQQQQQQQQYGGYMPAPIYQDHPALGMPQSPPQSDYMDITSAGSLASPTMWEKRAVRTPLQQHPALVPPQYSAMDLQPHSAPIETAGPAPPVEMEAEVQPIYELAGEGPIISEMASPSDEKRKE